MISEICPTEAEEEPASGLPHFVDEDSIQSEVEDKEQSMFGKRKFIMYFMIFMWFIFITGTNPFIKYYPVIIIYMQLYQF